MEAVFFQKRERHCVERPGNLQKSDKNTRVIQNYAFLDLAGAHQMRGALGPQESTDFFSDFFDHPRLAA